MKSKRLSNHTILNNRYEIIRCLGQGGFGITYSAKDTRMEQDVVIKEYFPQQLICDRSDTRIVTGSLPDETNLYDRGKVQFLNEARTLATLFDIPGVVKVLDYFEENNTAYIVMEYIKGVSLLSWLDSRNEPCSFNEACEMLSPIMDALEKIHKKGLIHRDISPDNIMVLEDGSLKLLDFGAAREFFLENDKEKTMTVLIKSGYAPPEQYESKGKHGPWTDVYSLSCVIYEMITGTIPQGSLERQLTDNLYVPSAFGSDITPEKEDALILKGMSLDPTKRYRSIKKMKADYLSEPKEKDHEKKKRTFFIAIALFALLAIIAAIMIFKDSKVSPESVAGSYERGSSKYEQFLDFVKENAISKEKDPEDKDATIYKLSKKSVLEWGERCNLMMYDMTVQELTNIIKSSGHTLRHIKSTETYTVTVRPYGVVETEFTINKHFKCDNSLEVKIVYDILTNNVCGIYIYLEPSSNGDLHSLAADIYMALDKECTKSKDEVISEFKKNYQSVSNMTEGFSGYDFPNNWALGYMVSPGLDNAKDKIVLVFQNFMGPPYYWP